MRSLPAAALAADVDDCSIEASLDDYGDLSRLSRLEVSWPEQLPEVVGGTGLDR